MLSSVPQDTARRAIGRHHHARQVGIVEAVGMPDALERHQLQVLATEGMRVAGGEVGEGHPVAAADARIEVLHLAGEAVRRQPLGHRVGIEEGAVDALGRRAQDAVQGDGSAGHGWPLSLV
jgi:hypothetical protein